MHGRVGSHTFASLSLIVLLLIFNLTLWFTFGDINLIILPSVPSLSDTDTPWCRAFGKEQSSFEGFVF